LETPIPLGSQTYPEWVIHRDIILMIIILVLSGIFYLWVLLPFTSKGALSVFRKERKTPNYCELISWQIYLS